MSIINPALTRGKGRVAALGLAAFSAFAGLNACLFRVQQNEVAFVTRFGRVLNPEAGPLPPGLHVKVPIADSYDVISVSSDTFRLPAMKAFTRDTQEVTLQVALTYRVPVAAAYHLLYEVGRSGNVDITRNFEAVANDRVRSIVSRRDVTDLGGEPRERVLDEIKQVIAQELKRLYAIDIQDVQIPLLDFSAQYKEAVNKATLARAQRIQAEQDRERVRIEAETVIVRAKGEADGQVARAEGQAKAQVVQAKAEAEGARLRGDADAAVTTAKIAAAGGVDSYVRQVQAQAWLNWKGGLPNVVGGGMAQMPLVVPLQKEDNSNR